MVNPLKWFRAAPSSPDSFSVSGGQQTKDTRRIIAVPQHFAAFKREERLKLFATIYATVPLAIGAVNVLTRMVNTRILPKSGGARVDARMRQIWREYNLAAVNAQLLRQAAVYGFGVAEMVWGEKEPFLLDRVVVPPSLQIRKVPDINGVIQNYTQLPDPLSMRPLPGGKKIDPVKIIDLVRDPTDGFDYYGSSLFESAVDQFESLCKILDARINVYMRTGKPRYHILINAEGLSPEQFQDRIDKTRKVFSDLADGTDIYSPAGVDIKIIGAESFGQKFADETRLVVSMILAGIGLPPALMNVIISPSVGTESFVRQQIISLQTMLDNMQNAAAQAWNCSFWHVIQKLEGMPVTPVMQFERPRLLEQQIEEEARRLRRNNDLWEVTAGIRSPQWLVQQVGAVEADDPAALPKMIEDIREQQEQPEDESSDRVDGTKVTDSKAANNTTIWRGHALPSSP